MVVDPSGHRWMISSAPAATPTPRHGDLAYLTHTVTDTARAQAFYGAVLGWTFTPGRVEDGWHIEGTYPPAGMHGDAGGARGAGQASASTTRACTSSCCSRHSRWAAGVRPTSRSAEDAGGRECQELPAVLVIGGIVCQGSSAGW